MSAETEAEAKAKTRYMFYLELFDGTAIEWRGLSLADARKLYALTNKKGPQNMDAVKRYGWEEMK